MNTPDVERGAVDAEWERRAAVAEAEETMGNGSGFSLSDMSNAELQQMYDTAGLMAANDPTVPMGNSVLPEQKQAMKDAIIKEQLKRKGISIGNSDYLNAIADGGGPKLVDETTVIPGRTPDNYLEAKEMGAGQLASENINSSQNIIDSIFKVSSNPHLTNMSPFNLDFGKDYTNAASFDISRKNYQGAALNYVNASSEMVYDGLAAYAATYTIPAVASLGPALQGTCITAGQALKNTIAGNRSAYAFTNRAGNLQLGMNIGKHTPMNLIRGALGTKDPAAATMALEKARNVAGANMRDFAGSVYTQVTTVTHSKKFNNVKDIVSGWFPGQPKNPYEGVGAVTREAYDSRKDIYDWFTK